MESSLKFISEVKNKMNQEKLRENTIKSKNNWLDLKLKEYGLTEFKRVGDYSDRNVMVYHSVCNKTMEVNPENFFRRKVKCDHCFQVSKNNEFQEFLNSKFNNEFELMDDYKASRTKVRVKHIVCGKILNRTPEYFNKKDADDKICSCQEKKVIKVDKDNPEYIKKMNRKFDNKLIKKGLIDYKRKSDYIDDDTKIVMYHIKCKREFEVEPKNFFRRQNKCLFCYNQERKNKKLSLPKNDFFQNKIDKIGNKEFELLSDYYNLGSYVSLKHKTCGHIFEVRADNFESNKEKCPKCAGRDDVFNKTITQKIKELESQLNNEYEIITKAFTYSDMIKLRHKACGNEFYCSVSSVQHSKGRKRIKCPKCELEDRREEFLDKLNRMYKNKFTLAGAYKGINRSTLFRHRECGRTFKVTPYYMLKSEVATCPECRAEMRHAEFKNKLKSFYDDEYVLVGKYDKANKKVKLKHKTCGSIIDVYPTNLFKVKYLCKECNKDSELLRRKEKCVLKINNKYNGLYTLEGDYSGTKIKTQFRCNNCKQSFSERPEILLYKNKRCPHCKSKTK